MMRAINQYIKQDNGTYKVTSENPILGKITGTMLGGIMGLSPWETPFTISVKLLRIFEEDKGDVPALNAGKYLEPVILNYLDKTGRLENTQAEVLFPHYEEGSHLDWKSHFDDELFSGHIDAIAGHVDDAYKGIGIVENKTTTHPEAWDFINNIPPKTYWLQASLYAYFFGYEDIYFTVGILTSEEQDNPALFVPNEDNVKIMKVGLYPDFQSILDRAKEWYIAYIQNGVTPAPDMENPRDRSISIMLDAQIATADEILPMFHEYVRMNNECNELAKKVEELKKALTAYMDIHGMDGIGNSDLYYKYSTSTRKSVDTDKMKSEGIYDSYVKEISYKVFKKAKYSE